MTRFRTRPAETAPPLAHRLLATGCAAIVLLLAVLAVSPALHAWLHGHANPDTSDRCAVVLFAGGVTLAAAAIAIAAPRAAWRERPAAPVRDILLVSSRYLRQPERGPPAC
jgi:hypothetical protein